jgi:hypothetical protein
MSEGRDEACIGAVCATDGWEVAAGLYRDEHEAECECAACFAYRHAEKTAIARAALAGEGE